MDPETARRQIEDLIHDCAHAIDDDRLEDWPGFFTADCRYAVTSRESHEQRMPVGIIVCEGRGMLADRILALREANIFEPHRYRHLISGIRIRGEADGRYEVESSFAVIRTMQEGDISVFLSGKYLDRIVFAEDGPKLRERVVVCDSSRIDTLIVIPP